MSEAQRVLVAGEASGLVLALVEPLSFWGGFGPAALIMREPDEIVNLGAIVADELYGITVPILIVDEPTFIAIAAAERATISSSGTITF